MRSKLLIIGILLGVYAHALEILPQGRLFPITFADPREIKMSINFEKDERMSANIGNYFSLLGWNLDDDIEMQFGIEGGGYFLLRQEGGRFPLETTDGLIGIYQELKIEDLKFQFRFTHLSSHLSDGSNRTAIAYSKEWIALRALYDFNSNLFLYGGVSFNTHSIPDVQPWALQWGAELFANSFSTLMPYMGLDFKWRQDSVYNPSFQIQLGLALKNQKDLYRNFKLFYSYYTGANYRGQFYNEALTQQIFGIEMQI